MKRIKHKKLGFYMARMYDEKSHKEEINPVKTFKHTNYLTNQTFKCSPNKHRATKKLVN